MRLRLQRSAGDDVRAIWLLAVLVLGFGSYFIETKLEHAIAAAHERTESLYRRMVSNERIVQQATALARIQTAALSDLQHVSHETSLAATTASLVTMLDGAAKRYDLQVTGVEPGPAQSTQATAFKAGGGALTMTGLTIRARGRFRSLLQFVEGLSRDRTLVSVSDTQLVLASGESEKSQPKLDATIHATLYRLRMPFLKPEERVASDR